MNIIAESREFLGKTEYYSIEVKVERDLKTYRAEVTEIVNIDADGNSVSDYTISEIDPEIADLEDLILDCLEDEEVVIQCQNM